MMSSKPRQSRLVCVFPVVEEQAVDRHCRKPETSHGAAPSGPDDLIDLSDIGPAHSSVHSSSNESEVRGIPVPAVGQGDVPLCHTQLLQTDSIRYPSIPSIAGIGVNYMDTDSYVKPDQRHLTKQGSLNVLMDHWSPGKYGAVGGSERQYEDLNPPATPGLPGDQRTDNDSALMLQQTPSGQDSSVDSPFTMKDILGEFRSNMNCSVTSSVMTDSSEDSFFNSRNYPSGGFRFDEIPKRMEKEIKAVLSDCQLKSTAACEGLGDTQTPSKPHETSAGTDPAVEADVSEDACLMKMMRDMTLDGQHPNSQMANGVTCDGTLTTGLEKGRNDCTMRCRDDEESHADAHSDPKGKELVKGNTIERHGEMDRRQTGGHMTGRSVMGRSVMGRREMINECSRSGTKESVTGMSRGETDRSEMGRCEIGRRETNRRLIGSSEKSRSEMARNEKSRSEMARSSSEKSRSETGVTETDKSETDVQERGRSHEEICAKAETSPEIQDLDEKMTSQAERSTDTEREEQNYGGAAEMLSISSLPSLEEPPDFQMDEQETPAHIRVEDCSDEDSSQFCQPQPPFQQTSEDILTLALPCGNDAAWSSLERNEHLFDNRSRQVATVSPEDKRTLAVAVNQSSNVQAVGSIHYNKHIYKLSTSEPGLHIQKQSMKEIKSQEKLFVTTQAYNDVWKVLEEEGVVFIVGPPGSGKTMIAKGILLQYHTEQDFEPLILFDVKEMRQMMNTEKQGIFIRNTFGVSDFDQVKLDSLREYFASVNVCMSDNKKFIFTCNNRIFQRCVPCLKLSNFFTKSSVVDLTLVGSLTSSNKRAILYKHFKQRDTLPENVVEKIVDCESNSTPVFLKCCQIFARSPNLHHKEKALKFFQKPVLYYKLSVDSLLQRDDKSYFLVLLLVMVVGELKDSFLNDQSEDSLIVKKAYKVLDMLPYECTWAQLDSAAKDLLREGLYLKRSANKDSFIFIDSCIYNAVAVVFGEKYPKHLLEICSGTFLCERVLVNSQNQNKNEEENFTLESGQFDFLSERFVTEIRSGFPYMVALHKAFGDDSFIKSFAKYCEAQTDIETIISSKDKCHGFPWLFWSSWNEKKNLFQWTFRELKKRKLPITKEVMKKIARACCISGNVESLKIVFKVVKSSSDMVKDCATMSLAMPTWSEASLAMAPVEGVVQVGGMLHTACLNGHLPVVELLVTEYHSPVDLHDQYGNSPLTIAAKNGHSNIVKFLMDQVARANVRNHIKMAVHEACENGRAEVVDVLLTAWPKLVAVPGPDPDLYFPIHFACISKEPKLVKLLVKKGADPKCLDSSKNTAFHTVCCRPGGLRVLKELNPTSQDLGLQNKYGDTCLHQACEFAGPPMVEFLLRQGADVNALNNKLQRPLHIACQRNHVKIAEKLWKNGADIFALDITHKPALKLTTDKRLRKLLLEQMNRGDNQRSHSNISSSQQQKVTEGV
ncbi:uncharacterized protein [Haliotis cracherodii]|uniref:uncharacterized protein n=1 Tax=Haliotis cracherodii TaxID=6455 RepID=UPI0039EA35E0